jgi:N-acetylmuramoyl-L-alanine amidase
MITMNRVKAALAVGVAAFMCGAASASAQNLMLEYDGGVHEYFGSVYALVVNNQLLEPPLSPIIFNDHALVPVREIFEELGAEVTYNDGVIEVKNDDTYIRMKINDNVAYVNGKKTKIPDNVVPKLISKTGGETKTMVPVRFISETLGMDVEFDSDYEAIIIASQESTINDDYAYDSIIEEPVQEEASDEAEEYTEPEELKIDSVSYDVTGSNTVEIYVNTTGHVDINAFEMSSPNRLVMDFANFKLSDLSNIQVGEAGVSALRFGDNGERARIVADIDGSVSSYDVTWLSDTQAKIKIVTAPKPTTAPTASPAASSSAQSKPTTGTSNSSAAAASSADSSKLIILDAGHGGSDSGAIGYLDGKAVYEKDLTLSITYKIKSILESKGYTTQMTRTGDTLPSLTERPAMANSSDAAIFVSVHINSSENESPNGIEVYYSLENNGSSYGTTSAVFAQNLLDRLEKYTQANNRGVKTANHAVTRRCDMPASLVEVGFISNTNELRLMCSDEYQNKIAQGVAEGVMMTLKNITVPN